MKERKIKHEICNQCPHSSAKGSTTTNAFFVCYMPTKKIYVSDPEQYKVLGNDYDVPEWCPYHVEQLMSQQ